MMYLHVVTTDAIKQFRQLLGADKIVSKKNGTKQ